MLTGVINSTGTVVVLSQRELSGAIGAAEHIFYQLSGRIKAYRNRWVLFPVNWLAILSSRAAMVSSTMQNASEVSTVEHTDR